MCSMQPQGIAEIGQAIDDLAAEMLADASTGTDGLAGAADPSQAVARLARLAELWERLAELDPEVAKRLPRYRD